MSTLPFTIILFPITTSDTECLLLQLWLVAGAVVVQ
jgi:hypothetical protein